MMDKPTTKKQEVIDEMHKMAKRSVFEKMTYEQWFEQMTNLLLTAGVSREMILDVTDAWKFELCQSTRIYEPIPFTESMAEENESMIKFCVDDFVKVVNKYPWSC